MDELASNTLDLHYTLAFPENFGITSYEPTLACFSPEDIPLIQQSLSEKICSLEEIDAQKLDPEDAFLHSLLLRSLKNSLALNQFPYYTEPLSSTSGMHSQLLILLSEYQFRCTRDVEDYLALLDQVDEYLDSLLVYEQEKKKAGFLMPASFLCDTVQQCRDILTLDDLSPESHFLQTTFQLRVEQLEKENHLTREQAEKYKERHNQLLLSVLLPAYQNLALGLEQLIDEKVIPKGLGNYPEGKSYYEHLLISQTGSYRNIPDIKKMLIKQFLSDLETLRNIQSGHPGCFSGSPTDTFPISDAKEMLQHLQDKMQSEFPPLPAGQTSIALKSVVPSMEELCAPAFFMTPPLDDTMQNTIYINHSKTPEGLELYTTLAHEGFPGHLYQNVYCNRNSLQLNENPARHLLWYGGYLEGWAVYSEMRSFDYASLVFTEHNQPEAALRAQYAKHNRSMQLCLYSLLDIMIHYDCASFSDIYEWLTKIGVGNTDTIRKIYNYILQEPCNYLKYYLGYLEILSLREDAKSQWGEAYSDYGFHSFFLNCGPSDFIGLQEQLAQTDMPLTPP